MGGSIAFTTDYVLRGVSQSHGAGALQAQIHYQTPGGWLAGLWVQGGWGIDVLRYTETAEVVSQTSKANGVRRGIGYWLL